MFAPGVPRRWRRGLRALGRGMRPPGAPAAAAPRWSTLLVWEAGPLPGAQHPVCRGGSRGRPTDRASWAKEMGLSGCPGPPEGRGEAGRRCHAGRRRRGPGLSPPRLVAPAVFTHGRLASAAVCSRPVQGPEVAADLHLSPVPLPALAPLPQMGDEPPALESGPRGPKSPPPPVAGLWHRLIQPKPSWAHTWRALLGPLAGAGPSAGSHARRTPGSAPSEGISSCRRGPGGRAEGVGVTRAETTSRATPRAWRTWCHPPMAQNPGGKPS